MASLISEDRVKETTTTTGTGNVTLAGAATGYRAFSAVMANNDTCLYVIEGGAEWEVGIGTFVSATPALARTTVLSSSNAGALVNFSAGTKNVFLTLSADRLPLVLSTADPTAPASGAFLYSQACAGKTMPRFIGPTGAGSCLQNALWQKTVCMWLPGTSTTAAISFGVAWTVGATQAHPSIADTSVMTSIRRATFTTTTTAGNASGIVSASQVAIRNRGFFFAARWGILTYVSTMQAYCGLTAGGALAGDPSAVNDTVAMSKDTGETTWQVMTRDTTAASKTSTGRATAAAGNAEVFEFVAYCKPGDSQITVMVTDIATGTVLVNNVSKASNLPTGATPLNAVAYARNNAGGAGTACAIFLSKIYVESDL